MMRPADVVMLGDSLTDWGEWTELLALPGAVVVNHGVAGEKTRDVLARLDAVVAERPRVVALLVGINDLLDGRAAPEVVGGIGRIVDELRRRLPATRIFVQSLLPVDPDRLDEEFDPRAIEAVNAELRARHGADFVDAGAALRDDRGRLDHQLSVDGVHLGREGYRRWAAALRPHLAAALD